MGIAYRHLFPIFLVLLHASLVTGRAHAHSNLAVHADRPHAHLNGLLDLFGSHYDEGHRKGDDHDADALDLSDVSVSNVPPPLFDPVILAPVIVAFGPVHAPARGSSFSCGRPSALAGPTCPRYLAFCSLRN